MSDIEIIEAALTRTARRRRWQAAWRGFWRGFLIGGFVWLITLVIFKVAPVPMWILGAGGLGALACAVVGTAAGWWRKVTLLDAARWIDRKESFKERVGTAMELSQLEKGGEWRVLVIADAARCAREVNLKRLLPVRLPSVARWVLVVLAVGAGLGFVPEYRSSKYQEKVKEEEVIRESGQRLVDLTRRSLENRPPALASTKEALDQVVELGNELTRAKLSRDEALRELASVTDQIRDQTKDLAQKQVFKRIERAAKMPEASSTTGHAALQKKIEELQKALGDQAADSQAMADFKRKLEEAQQMAAGLNDSGADDAAAQDQLAQVLAQLGQQAQSLGLSLPNLGDAIEALSQANVDQMVRDLELAEQDLEKLQAMAETLQELMNQAEELGKDLPEQLERGQAEMAEARLEKMADQLESGALEREELKRMLDELERAVEPSELYGNASEFLKQAVAQMKQGNQQAAAQSLRQAAQELENLMQELADVESLMKSLENLQRAQMCVGNCMRWGMCKSKPRAGQGGNPGRGVGTWSDASQMMDLSELRDQWDNSGITRPDLDPRGPTDRGEGQVSENMTPTKVKGTLNPGGPMPSITLKGVSIKGLSRVEYTEAVRSAQSSAQSALNQDLVPRAYQNTVREYFGGLNE